MYKSNHWSHMKYQWVYGEITYPLIFVLRNRDHCPTDISFCGGVVWPHSQFSNYFLCVGLWCSLSLTYSKWYWLFWDIKNFITFVYCNHILSNGNDGARRRSYCPHLFIARIPYWYSKSFDVIVERASLLTLR